MKILMHIPDVIGSSKVPGYERWVECQSVQWGVGRGIGYGRWDEAKSEQVQTEERIASPLSVSEIVISKGFDCASAFLVRCAKDKSERPTRIVILDETPGGLRPTLEYQLHRCLISGFSIGSGALGSAQTVSPLHESVSLNFTRLDLVSHLTPEGVGDPISVSIEASGS